MAEEKCSGKQAEFRRGKLFYFFNKTAERYSYDLKVLRNIGITYPFYFKAIVHECDTSYTDCFSTFKTRKIQIISYFVLKYFRLKPLIFRKASC